MNLILSKCYHLSPINNGDYNNSIIYLVDNPRNKNYTQYRIIYFLDENARGP